VIKTITKKVEVCFDFDFQVVSCRQVCFDFDFDFWSSSRRSNYNKVCFDFDFGNSRCKFGRVGNLTFCLKIIVAEVKTITKFVLVWM
jgi:hypothetical protein